MCDYCEKEKVIFEQDFISPTSWGWGHDDVKINLKETSTNTKSIFIDRGYLRMVNEDDSQCLDHGGKVEIKYCPFCGEKLNN